MEQKKGTPRDLSREVLEGRPPHLLYWDLCGFTTFNPPAPKDFRMVNGRKILNISDNRDDPDKPFASRQGQWYKIDYANLKFSKSREGNTDLFVWETPGGNVTARRHMNHMTEYPVKTLDDIPLWNYIQKNLVFGARSDFTPEDAGKCWLINFKWSPVQELLQFDTGVENFYYFLADARDEMESLMATMHEKNLEALEIGLGLCHNATVIYLGENTSSRIISPSYYRRYSLPHIGDYTALAHNNGKRFIVHMCGALNALLDCFKETGMDGIQSVTPPPLGDTYYMTVREKFSQDFTIIGRLNTQLWVDRTDEQIFETLEDFIPERLIHTPFCLLITPDGLQPTCENVLSLTDALGKFNEKYTGIAFNTS